MIMHSVLLIGQSNMAGRGDMTGLPALDERIKVLKNGRWQRAFRPVNPDRVFSGACLAETFAEHYVRDHDVPLGIIPCADGGTSLDQWHAGGLLYDNAVFCTRLAQRTTTVTAVLWHQGCSDCKEERWKVYEEKLSEILGSLRRDLGLENVPFLLGGLGHYLSENTQKPNYLNYPEVNRQLEHYAATHPMTGFVDSEGLTHKGDLLHFDTPSLYTFGERYYEAFRKLEDPDREFPDKPDADAAIRSSLELL